MYDLSAKTKANSTIWIDVFGDIKFIRSLRLSCAIKACLSSNDIDDIVNDIVNDIHIMMNKKNAGGSLRRLVRRLHLKCPVRFFAQPKEERLPDLCIKNQHARIT